VKETSGRFTIKRNQWKGSIFPKIYEIAGFNLIHLAKKADWTGANFLRLHVSLTLLSLIN
jgi:hypothetical protein